MPVNIKNLLTTIIMDNSNDSGQQFGKQLPSMVDLLSAPLVAAASANSYMVREQTRFLMDTCFVAKGSNQFEPIMIEMSLTRSVMKEGAGDGPPFQTVRSVFQVPILTMVPLNSLAVDNVDIDFSMEVVSYSSNTSTTTTKKEEPNAGTSGWYDKSASNEPALTGKLSYDSNDKSENRSHNASKLNVKIHAGTVPLPTGVTTMIDLYLKSINAVPSSVQQ